MKIEKNEQQIDLGYDSLDFKIGKEFQAKAMWALINLYQHKIDTPVKEVISNARDANRDNGKCDSDMDIELTDKQFSVRDYGKGMNPELVKEILTNFGASTKTGTNSQTGGFGIGFKSPLCRVNQFTFLTWCDGFEYKYIVAKNGDNLQLNLVHKNKSNEKTGTKVVLPLVEFGYNKDREKSQFIRAINSTVMFWDKLPRCNFELCEVDMVHLKGNIYRLNKKCDDYLMAVCRTSYYDNAIAVIDGIPYFLQDHRRLGSNIVFKFNTGDLKIHETRERLELTNDQQILVSKLINDLDNLDDYVTNNIKSFDDYLKYKNFYSNLTYKVDEKLYFRNNSAFFENRYYQFKRSYRYRGTDRVVCENKLYGIPLDSVVYYVDNGESLSKYARRLKHFCFTKQTNAFVTEYKTELLEKVLTYKNVSELELPEIKKREKKDITEIMYLSCGKHGTSQITRHKNRLKDLDYLYLDYTQDHTVEMFEFANSLDKRLIKLSKANQDFIQDYENFTRYEDFVANFKITEEIENGYIARHLNLGNRKLVPLSDIVDDVEFTEFKKMVDYYDSIKDCPKVDLPNDLEKKVQVKFLQKIKDHNEKITALQKSIEKRLPLLYYISSDDKDTLTHYVKAMLNYEQETK